MTAIDQSTTPVSDGVILSEGAAGKVKALLEGEGRDDLALRMNRQVYLRDGRVVDRHGVDVEQPMARSRRPVTRSVSACPPRSGARTGSGPPASRASRCRASSRSPRPGSTG